jgi:hypothetical protein
MLMTLVKVCTFCDNKTCHNFGDGFCRINVRPCKASVVQDRHKHTSLCGGTDVSSVQIRRLNLMHRQSFVTKYVLKI